MSTPTVDVERIAEIREIVCETLELEPDEITETSLFKEEHGADSLGAIELLAAFERRYGVVIEQAEMAEMINLRGVHTVVARAAGW